MDKINSKNGNRFYKTIGKTFLRVFFLNVFRPQNCFSTVVVFQNCVTDTAASLQNVPDNW